MRAQLVAGLYAAAARVVALRRPWDHREVLTDGESMDELVHAVALVCDTGELSPGAVCARFNAGGPERDGVCIKARGHAGPHCGAAASWAGGRSD